MKLETKRLIIRNFTDSETDLSAIYNIFSDPVVNKFLPWFPVKNIAEAKSFYQKQILDNEYLLAICLKTDNIPIGYLSLDNGEAHDLGYGLLREFWRQGITSEAVGEFIKYLKTMDFQFITATHDIENKFSGAVMKKSGFTYRYSYREQWMPKNKEVIFRMYQMDFVENVETYKGYADKQQNYLIEDF